MKRILALAGVAAAGVAAYVLLRTPQSSERGAPQPGSAARDPASGTAERVTPDAAALPYQRRWLGPDGGGDAIAAGGGAEPDPVRPPSVPFERELREPSWASEQEKELTFRLRAIVDALAARDTPIDIDAIECRRSQCRVAVHARDAAALGRFYAALETPEGLYGWADNLLLAPVETAPDGSVTTHVLALFERD